jgi:uncharacterized protein (DUF849 family)
MQEKRIRPELEVFDLGMANYARVLSAKGVIDGPLYVNVLLGNIAGAQVDPLHFGALTAALPPGAVLAVAGLGRYQSAANGLGLLFADGVRVGLEDNLWLDQGRTTLASNTQLLRRVLRLAEEFERPLLGRAELRQRLGLPAAAND